MPAIDAAGPAMPELTTLLAHFDALADEGARILYKLDAPPRRRSPSSTRSSTTARSG